MVRSGYNSNLAIHKYQNRSQIPNIDNQSLHISMSSCLLYSLTEK